LSHPSNGAEPFVSFRHARIGRIGEAGQMPGGWRAERLEDIEILDVGSRGRPWITPRIGSGADIPGQFAGLGLASYLPAPKAARVALAAEVTLGEWDDIADVLLIVRESKGGGGVLGQATRSLRIVKSPQSASMSHGMTTQGGVAEPVLMFRRETGGPGGPTVTFGGLAFGNVGDYPDWRFATARD
jgi:hypothetical protein